MLSQVPNTDCDRAREGASARLDGELGQLDHARLEAHLALCAECRQFAARITAAAALMPAANSRHSAQRARWASSRAWSS